MTGAAKDFVDGAFGERDDVKISVRASLNVRADAEAGAEKRAFAFGDVELGEVVRHFVFQSPVFRSDLTTSPAEIEPEECAALEKVPRRAHDHVSAITSAEVTATDESKPCRRDFEFPTELRVA